MATFQIKPIATAIVMAEGQVFLVKYKDMPDGQQGWFVPNDMLSELEHPTDAAKRILRDQVGIAAEFRGRDKTWHMSFHHLCRLDRRPQIKPSTDLETTQWFQMDKLPPRSEFAHHGWSLDAIAAVTAV